MVYRDRLRRRNVRGVRITAVSYTHLDLAGKGYTVVKGENSAVVTFAVGVSENRNLYAQINLALNQDGVPTGTWEAESWKTQFEETDDAVDEELHVLK